MIGKGSPHQRPCNRSDTVHATNETGVDWSFMQRNSVCYDYQRAGEDTSRSQPSDRATDDEGGGVGSNTANQGAEFEDTNGEQEDPFDTEEGVKFAE